MEYEGGAVEGKRREEKGREEKRRKEKRRDERGGRGSYISLSPGTTLIASISMPSRFITSRASASVACDASSSTNESKMH